MMWHSRQRGSIFGLDARVALIIFSFLTLVSGYTGIKAYAQVKAQGFAAELRAIGKAATQLQTDIGAASCHASCVGMLCTERNAYTRLMDVSAINSACASRWHGPYITPHALPHPEYGTGYILSFTDVWGNNCSAGEPCYLWVEWSSVALSDGVLAKVNAIFDGANEGSPGSSGTFMWEGNGDDTFTVRYRLGRSIGA